MTVLGEALRITGGAIGQLLSQPFYYIFLIGLLLHYRRQGLLERKLFNIRVHVYAGRVVRTVITGLIIGVILSAVMLGIGIHIEKEVIWCLGIIIVLLSLIRLRLAHLMDALAVLVILHVALLLAPSWQPAGWFGEAVQAIRHADLPGLLVIGVLLQLAEAILFRVQGPGLSSPVVIEGKRGKPVGAYAMEAFWPVPLWLLMPAAEGFMLPWSPLHSGEFWSGGAAVTALPVMIGCSILTQSRLPVDKARIVSRRLLLSSLVLLVLVAVALWWAPLAVLVIWIAVIWREVIVYLSRREELESIPLYTETLRGLRVLDVIPGSPAHELGIRAAETVYKVNGVPVHHPQSLHEALRMNPAFCKLEILNIHGESKFLQRAIYAGDHHQLGMIFAPDDQAPVSPDIQQLSAFHLLGRPRTRRLSGGMGQSNGNRQIEATGLPAGSVKETAPAEADTDTSTEAHSTAASNANGILPKRSRRAGSKK
ncbi:PDZ domain-containing protein [Paenibacillus sp. Z6-24]